MADNSGRTNKRSNLRVIAECGILAALVFIGTEIRIPTALGFMNLGDGVILVASCFLGPVAFFPAAIGSALGDLIAGYPVYIAPTFVIKGFMGLAAALIMKQSHGKNAAGVLIRIVGAVVAELIMVGGYYGFEAIMYGPEAAMGAVVFNLIQAGVAVILAVPLTYMITLKKNK